MYSLPLAIVGVWMYILNNRVLSSYVKQQRAEDIGSYVLDSMLGAGGMVVVFQATDDTLGRHVALKVLLWSGRLDLVYLERFRREAQAAASLQHPGIVSVYDRGSYDDTYYIAMEYLAGRSLKQVIREEAPLDPLRAIEITIEILQAARFAHRHGVIHRDLKPHNVIVDDSGHAKVTDFGIARAGASDMTETGSIMGTAQYLSPEQAQGHAVSAASDLYSVAVVLYEMLTGRVPFDAESAVTIALKHVSENPTAPTRLHAAVRSEGGALVFHDLRPTNPSRINGAVVLGPHVLVFPSMRCVVVTTVPATGAPGAGGVK